VWQKKVWGNFERDQSLDWKRDGCHRGENANKVKNEHRGKTLTDKKKTIVGRSDRRSSEETNSFGISVRQEENADEKEGEEIWGMQSG